MCTRMVLAGVRIDAVIQLYEGFLSAAGPGLRGHSAFAVRQLTAGLCVVPMATDMAYVPMLLVRTAVPWYLIFP